MDPCVNKIVNDIYFSKSTALVESNPTNSARGNLAKLQRAEAKGTNTECEYGVDGQVSVLQSPLHPPAHAKSKSRKWCSKNTEAGGTDTVCYSSKSGKRRNINI